MIDSKLVNTNAENTDMTTGLRIIISYENSNSSPLQESGLTPSLQSRLRLSEINLPDLNSRIEDVCPIIRHMIIEKTDGQCLEVNIKDENIIEEMHGILLPRNLRDLDIITHGIVETCPISDHKMEVELMAYLNEFVVENDSEYTLKSLERIEEEAVRNTLKALNYNMVQSAKILGISRSTLYRKIEHYGIELSGVR
jgi:DNA-binding NtrC family response regulator